MSKPYLSIIIPESDGEEKLTLALIKIDEALQGASFDYEIFVIVSAAAHANINFLKLTTFIKNVRYADSESPMYGEKLKIGVQNSSGNIRLLCGGENYYYLKIFDQFIPSFKSCDIIIGSNALVGQSYANRFKKLFGSLIFTDRDFIAFKEEAAMAIFFGLQSKTEAIKLEAHECARKNNYKILAVEYSDPSLASIQIKMPTLRFLKEAFIIYVMAFGRKLKLKVSAKQKFERKQ
ncbi:MAG: hypothetical protein HYT12_00070 [Candidatus Liptonbacteria bacterium]|nr:hypothetical protein [Candidatus Liptonbacteria bacterium]